MWSVSFFLGAALLGAGLAMDAFSVSLANGLNEPFMPAGRMIRVAGTFALFQTAMPLAGCETLARFMEEFYQENK